MSPCTSRTIVAAPRTLSVSEMFASLLRALGNWDAAKYLWQRHRVLQKPRFPMTHTIQDRTLKRNPPPDATFDESIWQHRRRLLCMARRILRDEADAEDAVQDAYVSALTHSDQFEGRSSPLTWISKILINQAFSQLRDKLRQPLAVAVGFDEVESWTVWCRLAHPTPMWPHHGHYRCPKCSRLFSVPWEAGTQPILLWRRDRILQSPRLPVTHTIQGPNLTRNPPPHETFDESIWHYRRRLLCVANSSR